MTFRNHPPELVSTDRPLRSLYACLRRGRSTCIFVRLWVAESLIVYENLLTGTLKHSTQSAGWGWEFDGRVGCVQWRRRGRGYSWGGRRTNTDTRTDKQGDTEKDYSRWVDTGTSVDLSKIQETNENIGDKSGKNWQMHGSFSIIEAHAPRLPLPKSLCRWCTVWTRACAPMFQDRSVQRKVMLCS